MEIASIYAQRGQRAAERSADVFPEAAKTDFGKFIAEAKGNEATPTPERKEQAERPEQTDANKGKTEKPKVPEKADKTEKTDKTGKADETNAADTAQATEQTAQVTAEKTAEEVNAEIIAAIAQSLNVEPEVVSVILKDLGIEAVDLAKPENLSDFVQKFHGVQTKAELLDVPNVSEMFKAIEKIVTDALKAQDTQTAKVLATPIETAQQTVKPEVVQQVAQQTVKPETVNANAAKTAATETTATAQTPQQNEQQVQAVPVVQEDAPKQNSGEGGNQNQQNAQNAVTVTTTQKTQVAAASDFNENIIVTEKQVGNETTVVRTVTRTLATPKFNPAEIMSQIADKIKADVRGNISEVKMLLKPESLGEVALKISTQNGVVSAVFTAENQKVKELIESNFDALRDTLQTSGIKVSELSVSVGNGGTQNHEAMQAYERERQKSLRRVNKLLAEQGFGEQTNDNITEQDTLKVQGAKVSYSA